MRERRPLVARVLLAASLVFCLVAARQRAVVHPPSLDVPAPHDIFSAAEPNDIRTRHLDLDFDVDFGQHLIRGVATHHIVNYTGTNRFIVDTLGLRIASVTIDGEPTTWTIAPSDHYTEAMTIAISPRTSVVKIEYTTSDTSPGLYWMTARQTYGDARPFLYTWSEPTLARSWIPLQDTPAVRMTYTATVHVPQGLLALMSAKNPTAPNDTGIYTFTMSRPIPAYLITLAVGRIAFHALDGRTGIYAEPELLDEAVEEFADIPALVDAAERQLGTYPFDRYDVLFAPGFIAGGMENPQLNIISDGYILGNGPNANPSGTIAHELAHSWFGDLVTCGTWNDAWLNEGFATFYEKRLYELLGFDELEELGYYWDRQTVESYNGAPQSKLIHRNLTPADSPSVNGIAPYQKASIFLKMLDDKMGREAFDAFVASYLAQNRFHWADDHSFLSALHTSYLDAHPEMESALDLNEWLYQPDLPSNVTAPTSSRIRNRVAAQANAFRSGKSAATLNTTGWTTTEIVDFLGDISDLIAKRMPDLDATFHFSSMNSPPVLWLVATAQTSYQPSIPVMERFLARAVSNCLPIYSTLVKTPGRYDYARNFYISHRDDYPPNLQGYLDSLFHVTSH